MRSTCVSERVEKLERLLDARALSHELERAARISGNIGDGEQSVRQSRTACAHLILATVLVLRSVSMRNRMLVHILDSYVRVCEVFK